MAKFTDEYFNRFIQGFFTDGLEFSNIFSNSSGETNRYTRLSSLGEDLDGSQAGEVDPGYISLGDSGGTVANYGFLSMRPDVKNIFTPFVKNTTRAYFEENKSASSYSADALSFHYSTSEMTTYLGSDAVAGSTIFIGKLKNTQSVEPETTPKIAVKDFTLVLEPATPQASGLYTVSYSIITNPKAEGWYEVSAVVPQQGDNPKSKGWYEYKPAYFDYVRTTDITVSGQKTYYDISLTSDTVLSNQKTYCIVSANFRSVISSFAIIYRSIRPSNEGWYIVDSEHPGKYIPTTDTSITSNTNYYKKVYTLTEDTDPVGGKDYYRDNGIEIDFTQKA